MVVLPDYQNQGITSALVHAGLRTCKELRFEHIFVLGHPHFYPKFGFTQFAVPDNVFVVSEIKKDSLTNIIWEIKYPPAFMSSNSRIDVG